MKESSFKNIVLRDKLLDICNELFQVPQDKLINTYKVKGRQKDLKDKEVWVRYLCMIWLSEHKLLTRQVVGNLFGLANSTVTKAFKKYKILVETRNKEFGEMLNLFDYALNNNHLPLIEEITDRTEQKLIKLSKEEIYHIKFMIQNEIHTKKIATHFRTDEYSIKIIKNQIENDIK